MFLLAGRSFTEHCAFQMSSQCCVSFVLFCENSSYWHQNISFSVAVVYVLSDKDSIFAIREVVYKRYGRHDLP